MSIYASIDDPTLTSLPRPRRCRCQAAAAATSTKLLPPPPLCCLLKSLGIRTPRSPHYHILGPSLICLSPQVSIATEYLASREYSIEYHFHTVSLEEHHQSSTHNSRECYIAVTFLLSSLDRSLEFKHSLCCGDIFPISPAPVSTCPT